MANGVWPAEDTRPEGSRNYYCRSVYQNARATGSGMSTMDLDCNRRKSEPLADCAIRAVPVMDDGRPAGEVTRLEGAVGMSVSRIQRQ